MSSLLFAFGFLFPHTPVLADETRQYRASCEWALSSVSHPQNAASATDSLIGLIRTMEEQALLGGKQLEVLLRAISAESSEIHLPSMELTAVGSMYVRLLNHYLQADIDRQRIAQFLAERVSRLNGEATARHEVAEVAAFVHRRLKVYRISGGEFLVPGIHIDPEKRGRNFLIHIPYDLEVMDVPVTHGMWLEVMKKDIRKPPVIGPHNQNTWMDELCSLDCPVEDVSYNSMVEFANRVSELRGVAPAYVRSEKKWVSEGESGDAELGTLRNVAYQLSADRIRDVSGFRLPMQYEWYRMIGEFSREIRENRKSADLNRLLAVGWFLDNQQVFRALNGFSQEVGLLDPIVVDGVGLFDLVGNVNMAVHRSLLYSLFMDGRLSELDKTPQPFEIGNMLKVGGDWDSPAVPSTSTIGVRDADLSSSRFDDAYGSQRVGFRLVRTVPRRPQN